MAETPKPNKPDAQKPDAVVDESLPAKSAGEYLLDSLPAAVKALVVEKVAAGLPLRDAIEVSRAQIAYDAALAASAKEKPAKAN